MSGVLRIAAMALVVFAEVAWAAQPVPRLRPEARPSPEAHAGLRCSGDGATCIRLSSYIPDVCRVIENAAEANGLDPNFFARLIWRESLFDAGAISHAGAQGIAQFMPGTAKLRALDDPFNPAEALLASADYLADLREMFGSVGMAAVAYNGGEARAERFLARRGGLPAETRAYVSAITGHPAETWRDDPPTTLDLTLDKMTSFRDACIEKGEARTIRAFRAPGAAAETWAVLLASHRRRDVAAARFRRLQIRFPTILGQRDAHFSQGVAPGRPRHFHAAQIGAGTRAEADRLCGKLRAAGGACMVLKN